LFTKSSHLALRAFSPSGRIEQQRGIRPKVLSEKIRLEGIGVLIVRFAALCR
jgi:hypothetical protein